MTSKNVIIVGAGIGGMATALRLSKKGYNVKILEKNAMPGGRLNQIKKDGFTFDTGPSFFSMSYEFEQFSKDCNIKTPFKFVELDPLYTVNFSKNKRTYTLYKDLKKLAEQFKHEDVDFENKMRRYLAQNKRLFHDTIDLVVKRNFNSIFDYYLSLMKVNPIHLPVLFKTFWQHVSSYFSSEDAKEIISLVAFFLGRTPFDTSAVYALLSYTEFEHDGYYNVEGGMYKITEGLIRELEKDNVSIIYNTEITDFEAGETGINYLIDRNKQKWGADIFLINSDAAVFRGKIFKRTEFSENKLDKMIWTMGALTIYLGINCKLPQINHHNYFLGSNFKDYASKVFQSPDSIQKPYYYVNVLSRKNLECAPEGCESLFFVCPVPDLRYKKTWEDSDSIVDGIISDFSNRISRDISKNILTRTVYTPENWQNMFNLHKGSGLGLAHSLSQTGGHRPKNFDEKFKNVFYVGASTVPGTGLPMGIISSKLALERIEKYNRRN